MFDWHSSLPSSFQNQIKATVACIYRNFMPLEDIQPCIIVCPAHAFCEVLHSHYRFKDRSYYPVVVRHPAEAASISGPWLQAPASPWVWRSGRRHDSFGMPCNSEVLGRRTVLLSKRPKKSVWQVQRERADNRRRALPALCVRSVRHGGSKLSGTTRQTFR